MSGQYADEWVTAGRVDAEAYKPSWSAASDVSGVAKLALNNGSDMPHARMLVLHQAANTALRHRNPAPPSRTPVDRSGPSLLASIKIMASVDAVLRCQVLSRPLYPPAILIRGHTAL